MSGCIRNLNSKRLNTVEINLESEPKIVDNKIGEVRPLNNIFYPPRTTMPSCSNILALENVTHKLNP